MDKVRVKKVVDQVPGEIGPICVRFEHAELAPDTTPEDLNSVFKAHVFSGSGGSSKSGPGSFNFSFAVPGHVKGEEGVKNRKQTVVLENDRVAYMGSTGDHLNNGAASAETKTYVGVRRKNKISFYQVTPITVSPFVPNRSYIHEEEKDTTKQQTVREKRQAEVELVKAFGSKKKRLAYESREKNKVTDMNESIQAAVQDAKVTDVPLEIRDTSFLNLVPPCNREAKLVTGVYNISDLLTDDEMVELEPYAENCLQCTNEDIKYWQEQETFSDYFFSIWKWLRMRKDDPQSLLSMQLVLYTEIIIRFYKLRPQAIRIKIPIFPSELPPSLVKKAFESFTTVNALNVRTRSDEQKDKACCYIMVLVLLASDYNFDVQLMSTIFQIHIKKLLLLAKAVGITVKYNSTSKDYKAMLKLPLPKPVENRGAGRRKR